MSDGTAENKLFFNGVDGVSGEYLMRPQSAAEFWSKASQQSDWATKWQQDVQASAERKIFAPMILPEVEIAGPPFGLEGGPLDLEKAPAWLDDTDLSQVGWGMIFHRASDPKWVSAVLEAMDDLLKLRRNKAGDLFRVYYREGEALSGALSGLTTLAGYQKGDGRDAFLGRHEAGEAGVIDPTKVPYYLLIVADPHSIPYRFQFALDADYAVGRIYFERLEDYASYARSLVLAESGKLKLPRRATFFGPDHDPATLVSSQYLLGPLADFVAEKGKADQKVNGWASTLIPPAESTHARLGELLAKDSPASALVFTASHGLGWPASDSRQLPFQGALLCQDWPGPGKGVKREAYFAAEDLPSTANLLGTVAFTFACFGLGTPRWDQFSFAAGLPGGGLAAHAFTSALPRRMLSLARGGALGVIGHVERAWGYSFRWRDTGDQTNAFKEAIYTLMKGEPLGKALDSLNQKYISISSQLNSALQAGSADPAEMTFLWTANNDARGYALFGDPAARLALAEPETAAKVRPKIKAVTLQQDLPALIVPDEPEEPSPTQPAARGAAAGGAFGNQPPQTSPPPRSQPYTALDGLLAMESALNPPPGQEGSYAALPGLDDLKATVDKLKGMYISLVDTLSGFADKVTTLEVKTYTADDLEKADPQAKNPTAETRAQIAVRTSVKLDGDIKLYLPSAGKVDPELLKAHNELVAQAQANRIALIKAAVDALVSIISPK